MRIPNKTPSPKHKLCKLCNTWKEITEFHKNSKNKDNLQVYCKECLKVYKQNRTHPITKTYQPVNKHKIVATFIKYCQPVNTFKQELHHQFLPPTDVNKIAYFLAEMRIPDKYNEEVFNILVEIWPKPSPHHNKITSILAMYCHLFYPKGQRKTESGFTRPEIKPQFKLCHSCQKVKPQNQFFSSFYSKDGLAKNCKGCTSKENYPRTDENNNFHKDLADEFLNTDE